MPERSINILYNRRGKVFRLLGVWLDYVARCWWALLRSVGSSDVGVSAEVVLVALVLLWMARLVGASLSPG